MDLPPYPFRTNIVTDLPAGQEQIELKESKYNGEEIIYIKNYSNTAC
jgi:hypothetical protein